MKFSSFFTIFILSGTMLFNTSCSSFLDTYDPAVTTLEYYNSKEGQQKLIVDIYAKYRAIFEERDLQNFGTDMYIATDDSPISAQFNGYNKDLSGLSPVIAGYWSRLYKIVQECNIVLHRCTPELAGNDYQSMIGEASVLRALAYYYLVETFGSIPLLTAENTDWASTITEVTRAPEEAIYAFIIDELEKVAGFMPSRAQAAGRLTEVARAHLLGKFYLTRSYRSYAQAEDLASAIEHFNAVMSTTQHGLLPRFADVFNEDNQGNREIIWAIQYGSDKNFNGAGNPLHSLYGFNLTALYPGMFALNQQEYSAMQRNYWVNPLVHEWFRHPEVDTRYDVTFKREIYINDASHPDFGQLGLYFPRWNDMSGDSRGAAYFYPFKKQDGSYNWYPAVGAMGWTTDAMPISHKFKETKIEWGGRGTREDVIIRMADTYLLAAEAYLKAGRQDDAVSLVNELLERAAADANGFEILKIKSPDELTLDRLLEERGCELFGEHDRWFDLKRTGTLLQRAALNPFVVRYNNLSETHVVRPIPYEETIKLKGLNQNTGYNN